MRKYLFELRTWEFRKERNRYWLLPKIILMFFRHDNLCGSPR
jgi:hypothetical protein